MNVLILGTPGQLGHELMQAAWPAGTELFGLAYPEFDMADPACVDRAVADHACDVVVNATAYTAVDKAETERDLAYAINASGVERLAAACKAKGVPLIHVSTDYVFDGTGPHPRPYVETDPVCPVNAYGATKEAGEALLRAAWDRHVIIRTSWVYASHGANFVKTMLRFGREREEMRVVDDQHGAPTAAADLAAAIVSICGQVVGKTDAPWGTYHLTGAGWTTWAGFAEHVFQRLERAEGKRPKLTRITTAEFPTPAARPANSRLDCSKIERAFGVKPPRWEQSVDRVLDELLASGGE
jgi:dTDP-4-dehydrorhamnose reductase